MDATRCCRYGNSGSRGRRRGLRRSGSRGRRSSSVVVVVVVVIVAVAVVVVVVVVVVVAIVGVSGCRSGYINRDRCGKIEQ